MGGRCFWKHSRRHSERQPVRIRLCPPSAFREPNEYLLSILAAGKTAPAVKPWPPDICRYSSMVEHLPSKQVTRVRFPLPAPARMGGIIIQSIFMWKGGLPVEQSTETRVPILKQQTRQRKPNHKNLTPHELIPWYTSGFQ